MDPVQRKRRRDAHAFAVCSLPHVFVPSFIPAGRTPETAAAGKAGHCFIRGGNSRSPLELPLPKSVGESVASLKSQRPAKPATASFEGETHVSPSSPLPTSVGESVASLEPFSPCARRPRSVRGVLSGRPDRSHQVRSRRAHLPGTATCGRRASDRRRCLLHRT